jgi:hypothetical protein
MNSRMIAARSLLFASTIAMLLAGACGASAQPPSGKIDLERFAEIPTALVSIGASFEDTTAICPEDQALLKISRGALTQLSTQIQPVHQTDLQI